MAEQAASSEPQQLSSSESDLAPDEVLMAGICAGDKTAFTELYDRHVPMVYALCLKILHRESEAEAVVSDVFLEVWRKPGNFDASRGTCRTYLLTLARSRAIDRWRAAVTRVKKSLEASTQADSTGKDHEDLEPSHLAETGERRRAVRAAIEQLDESQRETLRLAYFEGLTHREIAARLDMPLGTVKTRIRHALKALRKLLSALGESGGLS